MDTRPLPEINNLNRPYWDAARRGELLLPKCNACGQCFFPPRAWCPHCFARDIGWIKASGRASVISFSLLHIAPFDGYAASFPYVLAIVKLAEGPQLMSNIVNCDPDTIRIGDALQVSFEQRAQEVWVPQFEPARSQD